MRAQSPGTQFSVLSAPPSASPLTKRNTFSSSVTHTKATHVPGNPTFPAHGEGLQKQIELVKMKIPKTFQEKASKLTLISAADG